MSVRFKRPQVLTQGYNYIPIAHYLGFYDKSLFELHTPFTK